MTKTKILEYLNAHPEKRHRKFIPAIVEELTGIPNEKQIEVKVAIRRLQEVIPNDEKGKGMAEDWLYDNGYMSKKTAETFKAIRINGQLFKVKQ